MQPPTMPMPTPTARKIKDIDRTLRKELAVIPQTNATWSVVKAHSLSRDELKESVGCQLRAATTPKQVEKVIKSVGEQSPVVLVKHR